MKTTTFPLKNSMNRAPLRAFLLILFVFACFALSPQARAVCQEGCLNNDNTVLSEDALLNNIGDGNTAIGWFALLSNSTGFSNTATGVQALSSNTTGYFNTANGWVALFGNITGYDNTANGASALFTNSTGYDNTANGWAALNSNTTGNSNTASGSAALVNNTTGNNNTAIGGSALSGIQTGNRNIALGHKAGVNLSTGSDNIYIGNAGAGDEFNKIRIGTNGAHTNTFIAGISGVAVAGGVGVIIDARGHLGTVVSSERFKNAIKPMDKASEAILALKPVTFRYKHEVDPDGIPQFGLVAEDVEKVNPDLVLRDDNGKVYTVRYEAVNAMLLNEFLKEHREVLEQKATITQLKSTVAQQQKNLQAIAAHQQKQIEALTVGLQKVSAQLEASKPAPQMVNNP
jgi:hypothetical protein